jgi:hypothetical protein
MTCNNSGRLDLQAIQACSFRSMLLCVCDLRHFLDAYLQGYTLRGRALATVAHLLLVISVRYDS